MIMNELLFSQLGIVLCHSLLCLKPVDDLIGRLVLVHNGHQSPSHSRGVRVLDDVTAITANDDVIMTNVCFSLPSSAPLSCYLLCHIIRNVHDALHSLLHQLSSALEDLSVRRATTTTNQNGLRGCNLNHWKDKDLFKYHNRREREKQREEKAKAKRYTNKEVEERETERERDLIERRGKKQTIGLLFSLPLWYSLMSAVGSALMTSAPNSTACRTSGRISLMLPFTPYFWPSTNFITRGSTMRGMPYLVRERERGM
jgi:hypothetical protein